MKTGVVLFLAIVAAWPPPVGAQHAVPLNSRDSAWHALNRLAYGPRPGEIERVARAGVLRWIDAQLAPDKIDDETVARREHEFDVLKYDRGDLAHLYAQVQRLASGLAGAGLVGPDVAGGGRQRDPERPAGPRCCDRPTARSASRREVPTDRGGESYGRRHP